MNIIKLRTTTKIREISNTKKHSIMFSTATSASIILGWNGGTRFYYSVYNITNKTHTIPPAGTYSLQPGDIFIQSGIFCGKTSTPHFRCLAEDKNRVLDFLGHTG